MPNVFFKRGHQAALDAMTTFVEGAFYLTDDTNRLYFAQASNKLVDLNQYIHIIANRANLPTSGSGSVLKEGDIYYISGENILCIYKNGAWEQINPDTSLVTGQNAIMSVDAETNGATIGIDVEDTKHTHATGDFTIVGGANVHISNSGNTITIAADNDTTNTTYEVQTTLQTTKGQIKLHNSSSTSDPDSTIDIVGSHNVSVTSDANGTITIAGVDEVTSISDGFDETGEYAIELGGVNLSTSGVTPTISYGVAVGEKKDAVFANGTASLDVYTKDEIDDLLEAQESQLDAMHYAGTVNQSTAASVLVSAPVYGVGTTYKAASDINLNSPAITAKTGDLIIAGGNNDTAVTWEVVPSGDDQSISITGGTAEKVVTFHDGISNSDIGTITIDGGRKNNSASNAAIEVTVETDNSDKDTYFTVVHGDPGSGTAVTIPAASGAAIQATNTALNIPVITGISKDAQGHITAVTAQTYQLTDTHAILQDISRSVEAENNTATVSASFQLDSAQAKETYFNITSNSLSISAANNEDIIVNLEWGTFA